MGYRVLSGDEKAFKNMQAIAQVLNALCENDKLVYVVKHTYLDFGQDWKWTTIIRKGGDLGDVQILNPRQWEKIEMARTLEDLTAIVADIRGGKYFHE